MLPGATELFFIALSDLLSLIAVVVLLVLMKRIGDGVDRIEATLERRLFHIQRALQSPDGGPEEERWPHEP